MNTLWLSNIEILTEEYRADFRREVEKIRLEKEAQIAKPRKANWLDRRMHNFSLWMVSTGQRLHQRYHDPAPIPRWYQSLKIAK